MYNDRYRDCQKLWKGFYINDNRISTVTLNFDRLSQRHPVEFVSQSKKGTSTRLQFSSPASVRTKELFSYFNGWLRSL